MQDFYEILGVPRTADDAALRAAYLRKAEQLHPDRIFADAATNSDPFKQLRWAYEVLAEPATRADYDQHPHRYAYFHALGNLDFASREVPTTPPACDARPTRFPPRTAGDLARRIGRGRSHRWNYTLIAFTVTVYTILTVMILQVKLFSPVARNDTAAGEGTAATDPANLRAPSPSANRYRSAEAELSAMVSESTQRIAGTFATPLMGRPLTEGPRMEGPHISSGDPRQPLETDEPIVVAGSESLPQDKPNGTSSRDGTVPRFLHTTESASDAHHRLTFQLPPEPHWVKSAWERSLGPPVNPLVTSNATFFPIDSAWSPPMNPFDWGGKPHQVRFAFPTEEVPRSSNKWQADPPYSAEHSQYPMPHEKPLPSGSPVEFLPIHDRHSALSTAPVFKSPALESPALDSFAPPNRQAPIR